MKTREKIWSDYWRTYLLDNYLAKFSIRKRLKTIRDGLKMMRTLFFDEKIHFNKFCLEDAVFSSFSHTKLMKLSITWRPSVIHWPRDWHSHHFLMAKWWENGTIIGKCNSNCIFSYIFCFKFWKEMINYHYLSFFSSKISRTTDSQQNKTKLSNSADLY